MIEFEEEKRGYNKEQVSKYFETLELEYKNLFDEFGMQKSKNRRLEKKLEGMEQQERQSKFLLKKCQKEKDELAETRRESEEKVQNLEKVIRSMEEQIRMAEESDKHTYGNTIASALVSAEVTSKQIVESAKRQAEIIQEEAMKDLTDILKVKMDVLEEIKELAKRLAEISEEDNQDDMEQNVGEKASGGNESDGGTGEK